MIHILKYSKISYRDIFSYLNFETSLSLRSSIFDQSCEHFHYTRCPDIFRSILRSGINANMQVSVRHWQTQCPDICPNYTQGPDMFKHPDILSLNGEINIYLQVPLDNLHVWTPRFSLFCSRFVTNFTVYI